MIRKGYAVLASGRPVKRVSLRLDLAQFWPIPSMYTSEIYEVVVCIIFLCSSLFGEMNHFD